MSNLPNRLRHALSTGKYKLNIPYTLPTDRKLAAELLLEARAFNRRSCRGFKRSMRWSNCLYLAASFAFQMIDEVETESEKSRYEFLFRLMDHTSCLNDLYR